jgi:hypothetical protein
MESAHIRCTQVREFSQSEQAHVHPDEAVEQSQQLPQKSSSAPKPITPTFKVATALSLFRIS